ncbi:30S ribosomal protein S21 [Anaplasmataceae bacterium AB001_6]|nr:30S ribosomal protein S21 [Anaplasmataceae bacterium AB001_6]
MSKKYIVHHGDVDQAYRTLRKDKQREGISPVRNVYYEKPSAIRRKKKIDKARKIQKKNFVSVKKH